jgi:hypothetical protein
MFGLFAHMETVGPHTFLFVVPSGKDPKVGKQELAMVVVE